MRQRVLNSPLRIYSVGLTAMHGVKGQNEAMTIPVAPVLVRAREALAAAGVASVSADAELLAAYVLGVQRGRLVLARGFTPEQLDRYERLVAQRAARVPLQHLTGVAGFGHLEIAVGPGVFVPRPETELLAQWAVAEVIGPEAAEMVVVDLCSGSGALALAIAHARPRAVVYAVERSPEALVWLKRNAAGSQVKVVAGDATDPAVLAELDATVDLVVCNPPYVPVTRTAPAEVADYDPAEAVFAGADGLAVIRPLVTRVAALLRPGGRFGVEHDETHAEAVPRLLRRAGFGQVADHLDLAGRPRYATAARVAD